MKRLAGALSILAVLSLPGCSNPSADQPAAAGDGFTTDEAFEINPRAWP